MKNIFLKTLFEKRWTIFAWTLAIFVVNLLLIQIFPPIKEAFSSMTMNIPESMQVWIGQDGQIWQSVRGFVSMEVFGQMALIVAIFGVVFANSVFASEEKSGVILTTLSRPVSRISYFVQKYLAFFVATFIVVCGFLLGAFFGTLILGDPVNFGELARGSCGVLLLGLSLGSLTFALSAMFASGAASGAIVGFYAVIGYFIVSLRGAADILTTLSNFTPFYFYNNPNLIYNNFDFAHVLILAGFVIIPLLISAPIFCKRDLKTR